ncbi:efflux RND transporter permease subunit [Fervidobacterium nodosum]|uniref:Exporter of the RND superfamily protein-like protein n=1 Tax=Fervidobacterium nodosum (strain ATCC 35602 / DSM 5306 / Rt17-B1) TaxID=381764 RepID=A7HNP7_FERNB|nr:MMPL family transporter [Fervidobacterium nodosum]ABS61530.1 exporter of the RND superfamily protein-like protein [Fervidobacterium nodosum Rt17-B1]
MEKFSKKYVEFILKNSNRVLLILVILSILLGLYSLFGLKINADITGLAPKDDPRFKDLVKYTNEKVTSNTLLVAILNVENKNFDAIASDLKRLFESTPYIHQAEAFDNPETLVKYGMLSISEGSISESLNYYQSLAKIEPRTLVDFRFWRNIGNALYDLNSYLEELVKKSGIKKYYLTSPNNDLLVMNFSISKPMSDVKFVTECVENLKNEVKKIEKKYGVEIKFSGGVMGTYEANKQASKDFTITSIISIIGIVIVLILGFGNLLELILLFVGLLMSMAISLGVIALLLRELNIVTTFVNAMLLGLGIDYAMYIVTRIQERFSVEGVSEKSIVDAFIENFRPSFISMLTTAIAFAIMVLSPSNAIKQMGISVSVGIAIYFFTFNTFVPIAHYKLLNKFKRRERETYIRVVDLIRRSRIIYIFTIFATILFALVGIYSVMNFSYTASSLISKNSESTITSELISKKFGAVGASDVVIAEPDVQKLTMTLSKLKEKNIINADFSILSFIQDPEKIAKEKSNIYVQVLQLTNIPILEVIFKKYGLYESFVSTVDVIKNISTTQDLFNLMEKDIPSLFYKDINGNRYLLAYVTPSINIWEGNNIKKFFNSVGNYKVYGYTALFYNIIEELINSTIWVFVLVFIVELIILYIDFKNFKRSIAIIVLTVLNTLSAFGISYLVGIKTTFITFIVLPIFLGIGVDSLVEIDHSIKFGRESIIKTEKAIIMSILTTVVSFASFLIAGGQLLREFGFVTSAGLLGALFISIFWYLNIVDPHFGFKRKVDKK